MKKPNQHLPVFISKYTMSQKQITSTSHVKKKKGTERGRRFFANYSIRLCRREQYEGLDFTIRNLKSHPKPHPQQGKKLEKL
jgi:hypothetical protein